ncbi:hypothetical protein L210DRAFT_3530306 [Boletus edulis BED1]|uniref:Uncharacterized protein n=1 Tax=Boletus edulis BED1 TaxID=1328754 RepID=A0AAD4BZS9_BOLED|nr:hypothetical protein L210DRAFT_3530306 [Boletus edulis BED1]
MVLMPTLAVQILEDMDIESHTNELQSLSRASRYASIAMQSAALTFRTQLLPIQWVSYGGPILQRSITVVYVVLYSATCQ